MDAQQGTVTWSSFIPSIITASAAFIGALVAQRYAHKLTRAREDAKTRHLAHEQLFAPIAPEVIALLEASTAVYGGATKTRYQTLESRAKVFDEILDHIWNHLSHARSELLRVALSNARRRAFDDLSGLFYAGRQVHMLHAFMVEYTDTLSIIYPSMDLNEMLWYRYKYRLWTILTFLHGGTHAGGIMSQSSKLREYVTLGRVKTFEKDTEKFINMHPATHDKAKQYLLEHVFVLDQEYAQAVRDIWEIGNGHS